MRSLWKRLRGLAGLTSLGGLAGALFGGVGAVVSVLLGGGVLTAEVVLVGAAVWGGIAALATAGVGVSLLAGGPRESLAELSAAKAGALGVVIGATVPLLLSLSIRVVLLGLAPTISVSILSSMVIGGVVCGTIGGGLVTVAKRADAGRLAGSDAPALASGE